MIQAEVSAYTPRVAETDSTPHTTASGTKVRKGIVACPGRYDFGTVVQIDGERYTCNDRMNKRYRDGNYFDIFMWELDQARKWGRKTLPVKVITQ